MSMKYKAGDLVYITYPYSYKRFGDNYNIEKNKRLGIILSALSETVYQISVIEDDYKNRGYNVDYIITTEE